ncbi:MAG: UbiA family prenyltransferase [Candidatus Hodarchaeales archaeon]|jgi:1,4-dihydroxy-2-naphthoate octaprenyltransferase
MFSSNNVFMRLRGPNIVGSTLFALTGLAFNFRQGNDYDMLGAIFVFLSMAFFNILIWISNDYFDAPWDKEDHYKGTRNVFCDDPSSLDYKIGLTVMGFSFFAGLGTGLIADLLNPETLPIYFLFALAGMILSYLYTSPVFRAKGKAVWDWTFHVIWFQITFLPIYLYIFSFNVIWSFDIQFYAVLLYISMLSLLAQINHQIPDYEIDLKTNQQTTVVKLGIEKTIKLRYGAYLLISLAMFIICWINMAYIALILIVAYTLYLLKTNVKAAEDSPLIWIYFFLLDYLILTPGLSSLGSTIQV